MKTHTQNEIVYLARQEFGPKAKLVTIVTYQDNEPTRWWGILAGDQAIGFRRSLSELPALIKRGPIIALLAG